MWLLFLLSHVSAECCWCDPASPANDLELVFSDEFNGSPGVNPRWLTPFTSLKSSVRFSELRSAAVVCVAEVGEVHIGKLFAPNGAQISMGSPAVPFFPFWQWNVGSQQAPHDYRLRWNPTSLEIWVDGKREGHTQVDSFSKKISGSVMSVLVSAEEGEVSMNYVRFYREGQQRDQEKCVDDVCPFGKIVATESPTKAPHPTFARKTESPTPSNPNPTTKAPHPTFSKKTSSPTPSSPTVPSTKKPTIDPFPTRLPTSPTAPTAPSALPSFAPTHSPTPAPTSPLVPTTFVPSTPAPSTKTLSPSTSAPTGKTLSPSTSAPSEPKTFSPTSIPSTPLPSSAPSTAAPSLAPTAPLPTPPSTLIPTSRFPTSSPTQEPTTSQPSHTHSPTSSLPPSTLAPSTRAPSSAAPTAPTSRICDFAYCNNRGHCPNSSSVPTSKPTTAAPHTAPTAPPPTAPPPTAPPPSAPITPTVSPYIPFLHSLSRSFFSFSNDKENKGDGALVDTATKSPSRAPTTPHNETHSPSHTPTHSPSHAFTHSPTRSPTRPTTHAPTINPFPFMCVCDDGFYGEACQHAESWIYRHGIALFVWLTLVFGICGLIGWRKREVVQDKCCPCLFDKPARVRKRVDSDDEESDRKHDFSDDEEVGSTNSSRPESKVDRQPLLSKGSPSSPKLVAVLAPSRLVNTPPRTQTIATQPPLSSSPRTPTRTSLSSSLPASSSYPKPQSSAGSSRFQPPVASSPARLSAARGSVDKANKLLGK